MPLNFKILSGLHYNNDASKYIEKEICKDFIKALKLEKIRKINNFINKIRYLKGT